MQKLLDTATATDLLSGLAGGEFSSRELLEAQFDRIDSYNPSINAVVAFDFERAEAEAVAFDDARANGETPDSALAGLPMTVKDCFEATGMPTTAGSPTLADHVSDTDADLVTALRQGGAIVYGKTNVPLFAGDHQTFNDVYGVTRNPWDPERTPGGSSGGGAASVACGFSPIEIGSDIGGSIRVPAHFCGVFGLKPTHGVLSDRGHVPPPPGTLSHGDLAVCGPLGRSVADLQLVFDELLKVNAFSHVPGAALPPTAGDASVSGLRVGLWADDPMAPVSSGTAATVTGFAERLGELGAEVHNEIRPDLSTESLHDTYLGLLSPVMMAGVPEAVFESLRSTDPADNTLSGKMARFGTSTHRDWLRADEARHRAMASWARVFETVDIMVAPVAQTPAFLHNNELAYQDRVIDVDGVDRPYGEILYWAGLATMPLLPVLTIPAGLVDGLPCGVQLIGPRWSDHTLLSIGAAICRELSISFLPPTLITG